MQLVYEELAIVDEYLVHPAVNTPTVYTSNNVLTVDGLYTNAALPRSSGSRVYRN